MGMQKIAPTLYIKSDGMGAASYVQRLTIRGKRVDLGLGSAARISEEEVRTKAARNRALARSGGDPRDAIVADVPVIDERAGPSVGVQAMIDAAVAAALAGVNQSTNGLPVVLADTSPTLYEAGMRTWNAKVEAAQITHVTTVRQWRQRLEKHVFPVLGNVRVGSLRRRQLVELLEGVAQDSPFMATSLRSQIREILTDCMAREEIETNVAGEALASVVKRWNSARGPVRNYKSIPYKDAPGVYRKIINAPKYAAETKYGLCLLMLTACRSTEIRGMTWSEVNLKERLWTIPAERMKMGIEHRVPLSKAAFELLVLLKARGMKGDTEFVLPGRNGGLMDQTNMPTACRRLGVGCPPHGFRTTFRTWVAETTRYRYEVGEMQLAHKVGSAVERAYSRSDYLEERRGLMERWGAYLVGE